MQRWKNDPKLYNCERDKDNKKKLDYNKFVYEFMSQDEKRDWESITRCIKLWDFFKSIINNDNIIKVLDAGTKDGQMVEYLNNNGYNSIGIEIDDTYVNYAKSKNRNVITGDITNIDFPDNFFDVVFSHHVLGLCPDYKKAYQEMLRVTKSGGYIVTLNDCPGNPRKHYSLITNKKEVEIMLSDCPKHDKLYFDTNKNFNPKELIVILRKY